MAEKSARPGKLRCPIESSLLVMSSQNKSLLRSPLSGSDHHDCNCLPGSQRSLKISLL